MTASPDRGNGAGFSHSVEDTGINSGNTPKHWAENYAIIRENILEHNDGFFELAHPVSSDGADSLLSEVLRDAEVFTGAAPMFRGAPSEGDSALIGSMQVRFYYNAENVGKINRLIGAELERLSEQACKRHPDDVGRVGYLVAWLAANVDYGPLPHEISGMRGIARHLDAQSAKGALLDREAICLGYAKALSLLCSKIGVECSAIWGEMGSELLEIAGVAVDASHAWNMVCLDGRAYYIDIVNSKANASEDDGGKLHIPFLMGTKEMSERGYAPFERVPYSRISGEFELFREIVIGN